MRDVLYIDDEADLLEIAQTYFEEAGISIETALDSDEAFLKLSKHSFKVVISDAKMPGLKGFEIAHQLRSHFKFEGKFILVSGHIDALEEVRDKKMIDKVFHKPVDFDDIVGQVQKYLI